MSGLREKVAEAIDKAAIVEMTTMGFENCWLENPETCADAAIRAFAEAMRKPEVVARVARSIHIEGLSGVALNRAMTRPLKVTEENHRQAYASLTAALAALGVQEGED